MATWHKKATGRVRARRWPARAGVVLGLACLAAALLWGCRPRAQSPEAQPEPPAAPVAAPDAPDDRLAEALAKFNRGAALLEQYEYSQAAEAFRAVLETFPKWSAARFNLGVACLNLHGDAKGKGNGALEQAQQAFQEVLAAEPDHLPARFSLGLAYQELGQSEESLGKALECFEKVAKADPLDPYVAYKCAETLLSLNRNEEGVAMLQRVLELDPGFVSGAYRLGQQYNRIRQTDKGMPLLKRFQELRALELAAGPFTVDRVYGAAGKYYTALGAEGLPLPTRKPQPTRILFAPEPTTLDVTLKPWKWSGGRVDLPAMAVADLDGNGSLDVVLASAGDEGKAAVWFNDGSGHFTQGPDLADKVVSIAIGDVDNDGAPDLWLGRAGEDLLLLGDGKGQFRKAPAPAIAPDAALTVCARLVDLDSDGDLDLLALRIAGGSIPAADTAQPVASRAWNNNRDGTYQDVAEPLGLAFPDKPLAAVVYDDFDNDRDLDMVFFPVAGKPIAWVNDRGGKYRQLDAAATGLDVLGALSATSGDVDKDGRQDLLVFTGGEARLYLNRGPFRFELDEAFAKAFGVLGGSGGHMADMDNDGDLDIVLADALRRDKTRGPALLLNDWPNPKFLDAARLDPGNLFNVLATQGHASCVAADFTGNGKCDLLVAEMGRKPMLVANATEGGHFVALELRGTKGRDQKSRSNGSAIGARVEVRSGTLAQQFTVGVPSGPAAMPPLRVHAGLGSQTDVQWLRIFWPDGSLQAELATPADRLTTITQLNRRRSSCPHLFAWDGERFAFVSDFGGMGGLGYLVAPGAYAAPDPTEYVPLPRLEPRGDEYVLQVLEPLEEVVYLDEVKLIAVDHPEGTEVCPREMMAVGCAPPPFEVFCYRRPIEPVRALDHRGVEVTDHLRQVDRRYAGATELDARFEGFAKDHFVELDFGDRLAGLAPDGRLILFLYGWVEYAYSSTNYAASQAGLRLKAPSIHAWRNGGWVELFREVGYPAGLQHVMALDVTGKVLPSDSRLRISSNMDLYWDRVFLAVHDADAPLAMREVPVRGADLHYFGYPREYSPDGRQPHLYDYTNADPSTPWRMMSGSYTRYGEVAELLHEADDCYVIMAPGDEVTLRFPAGAFGAVPPGWSRSFLLKTDSYCKDMDLHTAFPDTVEPLPFHAMRAYPYGPDERYPDTAQTRACLRRFNTRQVRGW